MKKIFSILFLALLVFSCKEGPKELSPEEKKVHDSLTRIENRRKLDSMKKQNPFLIAPPDSEYTGEYVDKYDNGIIKFKGFFRFGQRHGTWISFYPNGILWSECNYDKGLKHGASSTYYQNGKKRFEGFYRDDLQDSLWIYYDTAGVEVSKIIYKENRVAGRIPIDKPKK